MHAMRTLRIVGIISVGLFSSVVPSYAQRDINQNQAKAGGITPGDAPGFPVTISRPGSYVLTSNLRVPDLSRNGIEITATNVTIDLNGFAIIGLGGEGDGAGIFTFLSQVTVVNGSITGMGTGLFLNGTLCRIENVSVAQSTGDGIWVGEWCVVSGNRSALNGGTGFVFFPGVTMTRNTASWNGGFGIFEAGLNTGGSSIVNNVIEGNGSGGLVLKPTTGYVQNVLSDNTGVPVTGGVQMGVNVCNGSPCP
jgi:hypothetical protein